MHHLSLSSPKGTTDITSVFSGCQVLVRFFALHRIKTTYSTACAGSPSISLSFSLAAVLPTCNTYCVNSGTEACAPTPSVHRLQRGLPGYLILFAPHAFVSQRQLSSSKPPSPLVFLPISTHFTATLGIPFTSPTLKNNSFKRTLWVRPIIFHI